ncbi:hypothetical protein EVAR_55319_1 [Eumeta japonica]|uniref:Uncharacterized protein n=1 Tax=Eumeta variegata TaxID=151549 RepID=A0A4C1ZDE4_EUMVA|nr:hypothetical protein EVAR_55319_1 [Eumeta japonica]
MACNANSMLSCSPADDANRPLLEIIFIGLSRVALHGLPTNGTGTPPRRAVGAFGARLPSSLLVCLRGRYIATVQLHLPYLNADVAVGVRIRSWVPIDYPNRARVSDF